MLWFTDGEMTDLFNVDTEIIRNYRVHRNENNRLIHTSSYDCSI